MSEIALATGWSTDVVRGKLRRAGLLERDGRQWVVSRSRLRDYDHDIFEDVFVHFELEEYPAEPR